MVFACDDLAVFAGIGFDEALVGDRHGFAGGADLEDGVNTLANVDIDDDAGVRELRKSGFLDSEGVGGRL